MRATEWILVALLGVVFTPAMLALSRVWSGVDYYSHGYLVPLVALWAASAQRRVLPGLPAGRDARGLVALGVSLLLYLVGMAAGIVWLMGLCLVGAVASIVLYLRGAAWLRALSFGIGFLLFMVPVPAAVLTPVIVGLQLFVSQVGVWLLRLLGYPVFLDGNVFELPGGGDLFVAEACSGITSLVTLLPLGVFLAYFTERGLWRRALLVATVVPVAMLGNLARVLGTVVMAERLGVAAATDSALHDWVGILTYVLACGVLLGTGASMRRWLPEGHGGGRA